MNILTLLSDPSQGENATYDPGSLSFYLKSH